MTAEGKLGRESMSAPIRFARDIGGSDGSFEGSNGGDPGDVALDFDFLYVSSSISQEGGGKTTGGVLGPVYESTIDPPNDLR